MNQNTRKILNHIRTHLHVTQIVDSNDTQFWNELDADIHMDVAEGTLDAELIGDDIEAAFDEVAA